LERHRRLLQELLDAARILVDVHAEQREAEIRIALMERLEVRHLLAARPAPRRPEVDHHDLALQVLERYLLAAPRRQREVRRGARDLPGSDRRREQQARRYP